MEKSPKEDTILALDGEIIGLKMSFPENPPDVDPIFLLNGSTENVGYILGFRTQKWPTTSFSTNIEIVEPGEHFAHAIWTYQENLSLSDFETLQEISEDSRYQVAHWKINAFPKEATLDDFRQVIDDLIRTGTMAYGGKLLLEKIKNKHSNDTENKKTDEEDTEYFQETITNY